MLSIIDETKKEKMSGIQHNWISRINLRNEEKGLQRFEFEEIKNITKETEPLNFLFISFRFSWKNLSRHLVETYFLEFIDSLLPIRIQELILYRKSRFHFRIMSNRILFKIITLVSRTYWALSVPRHCVRLYWHYHIYASNQP